MFSHCVLASLKTCVPKPDVEVSFFPGPRCWQRPRRGAWEEYTVEMNGDDILVSWLLCIYILWYICVLYTVYWICTSSKLYKTQYFCRCCIHDYICTECPLCLTNWSKLLVYCTPHNLPVEVCVWRSSNWLTDWQTRKVLQGKGDG